MCLSEFFRFDPFRSLLTTIWLEPAFKVPVW